LKAEALLQNGDSRERVEATLREALGLAKSQHAAGFAARIKTTFVGYNFLASLNHRDSPHLTPITLLSTDGSRQRPR
jgi:hypothetical protein